MLTDPFYDPAIEYSGNHVPVSEFDTTLSGYASGGMAIVALLQGAGWSIVDSEPSYVTQWRPSVYLPTSVGSGTPVEMTPQQCTGRHGSGLYTAIIGGIYYQLYDPYLLTPTCTNGTNGIVWVAMGTSEQGTANALASSMSGSGICQVTPGTVSGRRCDFYVVSDAAGFEFDEIDIFIGGSMNPMTRGYYTLRSPSLPTGGYMEVRVQTNYVRGTGHSFTYGGGGRIRIVLTIISSGGGEYIQPHMPGSYYFAGSENQFVIVPREGEIASVAENSSILVTIIEAPSAHSTQGNWPVVIGSDNGQFTDNTDQLRRTLHWGICLACGPAANMVSTSYRGGAGVEYYQLVTLLARGTVGRTTAGRNGQPLIQAPYICVPANPTAGAEAVIVGKLRDMIITSGNAQIGDRMMYDSNEWICISRTAEAGDVHCDLWTLAA